MRPTAVVATLALSLASLSAHAVMLTKTYDYTLGVELGNGTIGIAQDGTFTIAQDTANPLVTLASLTAFTTKSGVATFDLQDLNAFRAQDWGVNGLVPGVLTLGFSGGGCYTTLDLAPNQFPCGDPDLHIFQQDNMILALEDVTGQVPTFITRTYEFEFSREIGGNQVTTQFGSITLRQDIFEESVGLENVLDFEMTSGVNTYGLANLGSFRGSSWGEDGLVPGEFSLGILDLVSNTGFCVTNLDLQPPKYACDPSVYDTSPEGLDLLLTKIDDGGGGGGGDGDNDVPEPRTLALLGVALAAMAIARRRKVTRFP